jgi:predicted glycosyltransferase
MNVLIDLQHPADLHFFRNAASRLVQEGHAVHFTGRDKDILVPLAREYGLNVEVIGVCRPGIANLAWEMMQRQWHLQKIIRRFRPDVMMSVGGTYVSSLGRLLGIPVYVFYDTEHATISNLLAYPFATCIYVPKCYRKPIRWNHQRYDGYHELAYLHPKYFTPDPAVLAEVGVRPGDVFTIVRFVGWGAVHDVGMAGFTDENKIHAVRQFERFGRVFISCEGDMPAELESRRLRLPVSRIHHLMAYAALIIAESATMASESAVLGVPAVYVSPLPLGYLEEQQRDYGLVFNFRPEHQTEAIREGVAILDDYDRTHWQTLGQRLVDKRIDVTDLVHRIALERPFWGRR